MAANGALIMAVQKFLSQFQDELSTVPDDRNTMKELQTIPSNRVVQMYGAGSQQSRFII